MSGAHDWQNGCWNKTLCNLQHRLLTLETFSSDELQSNLRYVHVLV